jgi:hypothetical protein
MTDFRFCLKCPAFHLLTDERKRKIERWEQKRERYIERIKNPLLILLAESMPENRYFYELETDYDGNGLRYSLKKEFDKVDLSDSLFLQSLSRKGIILFDCALCPLYKFNDKSSMREAATFCFLNNNQKFIEKYPEVPIVTIFPSKRGFLKTKIPVTISNRVIAEFKFRDQTGLRDIYEKLQSLHLKNNLS